jgi:hypothetical protein
MAHAMTSPPQIVGIMMSRFGREYELAMLVHRIAQAKNLLEAIGVIHTAVPALASAHEAMLVSGSRKAAHLGQTVVQPIGNSAALVVRRLPDAPPFGPPELATIAALASAIAPTIDRLMLDHAFASVLP